MTTSNGGCSEAFPDPLVRGDVAVAVSPRAFVEADLTAALARDIDTAFEPFVIEYRQCIVKFVARMLGDAARAEDVAQDVFVRAYAALRSYSAERRAALRLRSWVYAIAHNLTRNAVRDAPPYADSLEFDDGNERGAATIDPQPGPDALAVQHETWEQIASAVARLSPRIRPAYVMRYLDELSYEEIAHALQQPIGTVKASAHRGALAVRSYLEHENV
jgi:RNA polymerase sigma-70 factor (ECF subfamily)